MKLYRKRKANLTAQDIRNLDMLNALQSKSRAEKGLCHRLPLTQYNEGIQSSMFFQEPNGTLLTYEDYDKRTVR